MNTNKQHPKYIGARIKAARQAAGYKSAQVFCKKHHIPYQTHSQHVRGARKPTDQYVKSYSRWLKVSEYWLRTGEGDPFLQQEAETINENLAIFETTSNTATMAEATLINKQLLAEILLALEKLKPAPRLLSTAASDIYTDIVTTESDTNTQLKMIPPMVAAYRRFLGARFRNES